MIALRKLEQYSQVRTPGNAQNISQNLLYSFGEFTNYSYNFFFSQGRYGESQYQVPQ